MILAQFWRNESQQVVALEITGHADAGPYGQDIVCAAVSAVTIGTINSLQQIAHAKPQVQEDSEAGGYLKCRVDYQSLTKVQDLIAAQTLMLHCCQTLQAIATNYADFIQVKIEDFSS